MDSVFKEYLVKQKKSSKDLLAQVGIVIGAIVLIVIVGGVGGGFFGPILMVAVLFGAGFLFTKFSKEYEYILTNNELDIDIIYSRSKRKRVTTVDMKKIQVMASIKDVNHQEEINKPVAKLINASDNNEGKDTYAIIADTQFGMTKVLITPNEAFLKELHRQAPNKVFKTV